MSDEPKKPESPEAHDAEAPRDEPAAAGADDGDGKAKADAPDAKADETKADEAKADEAKTDEADAPKAKAPQIDAIAARVAALGEDDELEKIARAEEEKLAARKGLEGAASKKLQKIGTKPKKKKLAKEAAARAREEEEDEEEDGVARVRLAPQRQQGAVVNEWLRENQRAVFGVFVAAAVAGLAYMGVQWNTQRTNQAASAILASALADQGGRLGDPDKEQEDELGVDPRPVFKTTTERHDATLAKYKEVQAKFPGTPAATLGRLGEAALLLDARDGKGALAAYEDVKGSAAAKADPQLRVRALEGIGFAQEALGDKDKALAAYKELEGLGAVGAKELGLYHQGRLAEARGDKDAAKALYVKVRETTQGSAESSMFAFVAHATDARLKAIDPKAIPEKGGVDLGGDLSEAKLKAMQEQIQNAIKKGQSEKSEEGH